MAAISVLPRLDVDTTDNLKVALFSDIHVGNREFDKALFERHIRECADDPTQIAVFLGDLLQADLKGGKHGGVYRSTMDVDAALDYLAATLTPLKGKIAGLVIGNHDLRVYDAAGIDPMKQLACRLDLADRYAPFAAVVHTRHGKSADSRHRNGGPRPLDYFGYVNHGTGLTPRSIVAMQEPAAFVEGLDWFAFGHTHSPVATSDVTFVLDRQHGTLVRRERRFVVTGSYQGYDDYAMDRRMRPRPLGRKCIHLGGTTRSVEVLM